MAVMPVGLPTVLSPEKYLRVQFSQWNDFEMTPVQAVYCRDFFADKIAAEAEYAKNGEQDPNNGWYTKTFVDSSSWKSSLCPNTTNLELRK